MALLAVTRPTIREEEIHPRRSRFVAEPLEPGFGTTLGVALRRTLLSSIPGAAPTSIRIDGVLHEFSTIPGVKEDVVEIILNLKELVLRKEGEEPSTLYLRARGPAEVKAEDILCPAGVEVVNPDLHIATLNARGRLEMEIWVEKGKGYATAEQNKKEKMPTGAIPVDSIFTPVRKVAYNVEATRVGQVTNYDRLVLDVETNGAVSPREALTMAGSVLVDLFQLVASFGEVVEETPAVVEPPEYSLPIKELNLSVRAYNCLMREGIRTIGDLVRMSEQDLLLIKNFGEKSVEEVKARLAEKGLSLKG